MVAAKSNLPLADVKVIEFSRGFAGPGTGMYLADLGADVIRVEPPGAGTSVALSPLLLNRGKRSIAVDLRTPQGQKIAHELVKHADVALIAAEPGGPERLGLGYEALSALNKGLIYAHITGWGPKGPVSMKRGADYLHQAYTGIMWTQPAADGTPTGNSFYPADMSIPMYLPYAITAALYARSKTGLGEKIETSQLQAQMAARYVHLLFSKDGPVGYGAGVVSVGSDATGIQLKWASRRPHHSYRGSDGKWFVFAGVTPEHWRTVWQALDLGEFPNDPGMSRAWTLELMEEHYPRLAARFATRTRDEWLAALAEAGVEDSVAPVLSGEELFEQEQVWMNGMAITQEHPTAGTLRMPATPFSLSSVAIAPGHAPEYAEHTDQVLAEIGQSPEAIAKLRADRVIE